MSNGIIEVKVGSRLWFDGSVWTVARVNGTSAQMVDEGRYIRVAIDDLMHRAHALQLDAAVGGSGLHDQLTSTLLASLTTKQRREVEHQVEVLSPLIDLHGKGDRGDIEEAAAQRLEVSTRTIRRRVERLRRLGPAGLSDERLVQERRTRVDPRWDEACLSVLDEFTHRSNPSRQTVIYRTNRAFTDRVSDGVVPSRSAAYQRVAELDKGRYTFGEAKQRRSVADRASGVMGQLRPTRPGEYILMDGYRLDVFAMEPVTMRWVNTELTVAMDLFDRSIKGIRLRPVAAKAADVASVLFQCQGRLCRWDGRLRRRALA